MSNSVEPRLRRLVADQLGIDPADLAPDISLTDDLAADSLDLLELATEIEREFDIALPEALLDDAHRYGDLLDAVVSRHAGGRALADADPLVWSRVVPGSGGSILERAGRLTPYAAEDIAEDALHAGPGARLEMSVPSSTSDGIIARLAEDFAWLELRGVRVSVHRNPVLDPGAGSRPHAA